LTTLFVIGVACKAQPTPNVSADEPVRVQPDPAAKATEAADAGPELASDFEDAPDGGALEAIPDGPKFYPYVFNVPVFSAPEWPARDPTKATEDRKGVVRLGYLRWGSSVVYKRTFTSPSCSEGWYELATGGFVCGKFGTTDPDHKELKKAPGPPSMEGSLPYKYGLNLTNGTPLYKWRPLRKDRAELEKGLQVGRKKKKKAKEGQEPEVAAADPQPSAPMGAGSPGSADGSGEMPWYLQDHHGKRPMVKLDDLKGQGPIIMRMVRGFYLAIDKDIPSYSGHFYRTTQGFLAPKDHILLHQPKNEFSGVEIDGVKYKLPIGFVTTAKGYKYELKEGSDRPKRIAPADRFAVVQLTGKKTEYEGRGYFETSEGWWLKDYDASITRPGPPPKDLAPGEKWIDVDLANQVLVAFEGEKPVFATIVSTGRHNDTDKSKDHRTVTGSFRIREKHIAATMEDDGASDGPYSIQDVPWIMYFEGSYALHGAFWHSQWGHERSHGCVNLNPSDAKRLFGWTLPALPEGWHGVRSTDKRPGTRVIVRDPRVPDAKPGDGKDTKPGDAKAAKSPAKRDDREEE
jgi:hypothetical protein